MSKDSDNDDESSSHKKAESFDEEKNFFCTIETITTDYTDIYDVHFTWRALHQASLKKDHHSCSAWLI